MRTGRNRFIPVNPSRRNCPDRRSGRFHHTHLDGRSMRSQSHFAFSFFNEESILHISCRVFRREVQCREIVPVIFNFRSFRNRITDAFKNGNDFAANNGKRMSCTKRNRFCRSCNIYIRVGALCIFKTFFGDLPLFFCQQTQAVQKLPNFLFFLIRNAFQLSEKILQFSF
ncbi:hypothetical protein D3C80_1283610 [compost metagenome]